ncbi:MAG: hypothetical protein J5840_08195 [Lachnospiraceae bacterium]|nr:hypothetical protein [Lachnospiraceae bacterium]
MKNYLYDALYLIPLSLVPVLWCEPYAESGIPVLFTAVLVLMISIIGILLLHLKVNGKIILGTAIISVAVAGTLICPKEIREKIFSDYIWAFLFILIAVGGFLLGKIMVSFRISRAVLVGGLIIALIVTMILKIPPEKPVVGLIFFIALCEAAEEIQLNWKKSGDKEHKAHLVYISPFLIFLFVLVIIFPISDKPFEWRLVKRMYNAAVESFERLEHAFAGASESGLGENFMGFSEKSTIGTGVSDNDKTVMEVKFGTDASRRVYMTGKTFDTFNGTTWEKTYDDTTDDARMDTIETVYSVMNYSDSAFSDYLKYTFMNVRYIDIKTRHIFTPYKYSSINYDLEDVEVFEEGGDICFDKKKGYDEQYKAFYYRLNFDNPAFERYLNAPHEDNKNTWEKAQKKFNLAEDEKKSFEDLEEYRRKIKEVYLPDTEVSSETRELLDEMLEGKESDVEKLIRIETYLSSMKYNEKPGDMPEDVDTAEEFLDYFLFDKREGYCVYFATAFVLMAREEGIPTRYVQGYYIPGARNATVEVTQNHAHAWPECYIDGVGWIAFEPTPGYRVVQSWQTFEEYHALNAEELYTTAGNEGKTAETETEEEEEESSKVEVKYILIPIGIAVSVVIILLLADILISYLRYKSLSDERKFKVVYRRNLHLLKILGLKIKEGETLEEFDLRVKQEYPKEPMDFIPVYEAYLYGSVAITEKDVKMTETVNSNLVRIISTTGFRNKIKLMLYFIVMSHMR